MLMLFTLISLFSTLTSPVMFCNSAWYSCTVPIASCKEGRIEYLRATYESFSHKILGRIKINCHVHMHDMNMYIGVYVMEDNYYYVHESKENPPPVGSYPCSSKEIL